MQTKKKLVITIVGRPNVGKSTIFNAITSTRNALVGDIPGITRDRQYGLGQFSTINYCVIDTGGLTGDKIGLHGLVELQTWKAVADATIVLFVVDARSGLTAADEEIARKLRRFGKPTYLVINKTDGLSTDWISTEFHILGFDNIYLVSAVHRQGIQNLIEDLCSSYSSLGINKEIITDYYEEQYTKAAIRVAIVGKPNSGKSTLINNFLGEERVIVYHSPGSTRDSISIPFYHNKQNYSLIDTAGVRRHARINNHIEKLSVIKTVQAIERAHVVIILFDAQSGLSDQDVNLLTLVLNKGRSLVIALNKCDCISKPELIKLKDNLRSDLRFLVLTRIHYISALCGGYEVSNQLLASVREAYYSATRKLLTAELTSILQEAVLHHQPSLVNGRDIKPKYAHQGSKNPPTIVIHGSRVSYITSTYQRYLAKLYQERLCLWGTPLRFEFRDKY